MIDSVKSGRQIQQNEFMNTNVMLMNNDYHLVINSQYTWFLTKCTVLKKTEVERVQKYSTQVKVPLHY